MNRKLIGFIFAFACFCNALAAEQDTIKVSTPHELCSAVNNHLNQKDIVVKLIADIDMSSINESTYYGQGDAFMGTIDGYYLATDSLGQPILDPNGKQEQCVHVIKNYASVLATAMRGATVKGIRFSQCDTSGALSYYPAILAATASDCIFKDIHFELCRYTENPLGEAVGYITGGYGFLTNKADHCTFEGIKVVGCSLMKKAAQVGSIVGVAEDCTFTHCSTDHFTSVYAENKNAYVGGLVGDATNCHFDDCTNMASVSGSEKADNVGGLTGISTLCRFMDCTNCGPLAQITSQTWISLSEGKSGVVNSYLEKFEQYAVSLYEYDLMWEKLPKIINKVGSTNLREVQVMMNKYNVNYEQFRRAQMQSCLFTLISFLWTMKGEIEEMLDPDEVGGISAASYGCYFERCLNVGMVNCRDAYSGGIVGYADTKDGTPTEIYYCVNRAYVQGDEQTGGIAGYLKDSHVYWSLNTGTVDCVKETRGPIYGESNSDFPAINCFAMVRDGGYTPGQSTFGTIFNVSLQDVKSGVVAMEMNRLSGKDYFRQNVGSDPCPIFEGNIVTAADIQSDVMLPYEVGNRDEFMYALYDQYADIILTEDIDFRGEYFTLYRETFPFRGTIDGRGHAIKNITIDTGDAENGVNKWHWLIGEKAYFSLLGATEFASFKDLEISDFDITLPSNVSILSAISNNCVYDQVCLTGNSYLGAHNSLGGLVFSSNNDMFIGCTVGDSCTIEGRSISGFDYDSDAASLASKAYNSTFIDCENNADILARTDGAGGIVADCEDCSFIRCINNGHVYHSSQYLYNDDEIGGIAATAMRSTFEKCINNGRLECHDEYGGGIVGRGESVTINNCLNASTNLAFESSTCGGIIGEADDCLVTNCFSYADRPLIGNVTWLGGMRQGTGNNYRYQVSNSTTNVYEMRVDSSLVSAGRVTDWLNNGADNRDLYVPVWYQNLSIGNRDEHPVLDPTHHVVTIDDLPVTVIITADGLMAFAEQVNNGDQYACAVLDADIDMSGSDWSPIGIDSHRFRGLFDGRGHTISGLTCSVTCSDSDNKGAGLFGVVDVFADIKNVVIGQGSEITSTLDKGAAGIVGLVKSENRQWGNVHISNCGSYASVNATKHAGGILGRIITDDQMGDSVKVFVSNCFNVGTITASEANSALLCGYMKKMGVVRNSWSAGQLRPSDPDSRDGAYSIVNPKNEAEYLVGYDKTLDIRNCYIINPADNIAKFGEYPLQAGVEVISDESAKSGEFAYKLNKGVTDGTQEWYQKIGTDPYPVRTKLPDGTNMVFRYDIENANRYANTSREEIANVILGKEAYIDYPVTDVDKIAETNVADLLKFISAAMK